MGEADDSSADDAVTMTASEQRHLTERSQEEDVETSRWRHSLMNRGRHPLETR
jgi:hypothetical protein